MGAGGEGAGDPVTSEARRFSGDNDVIDDAVKPKVSGVAS
jgi:hypothetical protein